jgi:hypothetical protein
MLRQIYTHGNSVFPVYVNIGDPRTEKIIQFVGLNQRPPRPSQRYGIPKSHFTPQINETQARQMRTVSCYEKRLQKAMGTH